MGIPKWRAKQNGRHYRAYAREKPGFWHLTPEAAALGYGGVEDFNAKLPKARLPLGQVLTEV